MNLITNLAIYLFIFIGIVSCANETQPTGGIKDEIPPTLISSIPTNKQTNFKDTEIQLTFDELITLNSAKQQLIITPRIEQDYTITYKKNIVTVKLTEPLSDSTTFTFNFRDGIQDLTEGNVPPNLTLAFSTGPIIDSLSISGQSIDLLTQQPIGETTIALFNAEDTLDILNSPPIYFAKTTATGEFDIQNLKANKYKLFAFTDNNKNLQLDPISEKYGFLPDTIQLDSSATSITLSLQSLDITPLQLQSARPSGHYFILKFNKYLLDYQLQAILPNSDSLYSMLYNDNREIKIYPSFSISDSLMLKVSATDTIFNTLQDTVYLQFAESQRKYDAYDISIKSCNLFPEKSMFQANLTYSKPTLYTNLDSLYLQLDSLNQIPILPEDLSWNTHLTELEINKTVDIKAYIDSSDKPDSIAKTPFEPKLIGRSSSFISVDNDSSQTFQNPIDMLQSNQFGTIRVTVTTDHPSFIIQLLDDKHTPIQTVQNKYKLVFDQIPPGNYKLRAFIDSNQNGRWDAGNISTLTPAEPIQFFKSEDNQETFSIRANWELDNLNFSF